MGRGSEKSPREIELIKEGKLENKTCQFDDPTAYKGYHPVKLGISLQGIGVVMIVCSVLHMFRYY